LKYLIEITSSAERETRSLPPEIRRRVSAKILELEDDPRPARNCRKLEIPLHGYRLRVGSWRILYRIDDPNRTVLVYAVRHRREAYRK